MTLVNTLILFFILKRNILTSLIEVGFHYLGHQFLRTLSFLELVSAIETLINVLLC